MKFHVLLAAVLLTATASAHEPEIGDSIPTDSEKQTYQGKPLVIRAGSAVMPPSYIITEDNVRYIVGVSDDFKIIYVNPDDPAFKTPEGISGGSPLSAVLALAKADPITRPGWAYYVTLPSGWNAAFFATPQDPTGSPLPSDAKVKYLFKSDWALVPANKP